jgi:hypothetical protein
VFSVTRRWFWRLLRAAWMMGMGGLGGLGAFGGSAPSAADSAHHTLHRLPCRPITTPTPLGGAAAFHLLVSLSLSLSPSLSLLPGYPDRQERPHAGSHPPRQGRTLAGLAASVGRTWLSIRASSRVLLPPDATALPQRCFGQGDWPTCVTPLSTTLHRTSLVSRCRYSTY